MNYLYAVAAAWLALTIIGIPTLYIGYGFVMCAKRAHEAGLSPGWVVKVDTAIAVPFVLLDALLNLFSFSVLMLDFSAASMVKQVEIRGRKYWVPNLVTGRLNGYLRNRSERKFRRDTAYTFADLLNAKDPSGRHLSDEA